MLIDTLISNVTVIDGSGKLAFIGNIGINDGKIQINPTCNGKEVIDGTGLYLTPGFIDSHSHNDTVACNDIEGFSLCKISQGITTEITGQCGQSPFPIPKSRLHDQQEQLSSFISTEICNHLIDFTDFNSYLQYIKKLPLAHNLAFNCGHSNLRCAVMGFENRKPTNSELNQMKIYLKEAMENGCLGLTSGLMYNPGLYADTDELIELCKVIASYGGVYATHIRNESDFIVDAINEAIEVAETAGIPLIISHHKIAGHHNKDLQPKCLELIQDAIDRGLTITIDQYPYTATSTILSGLIPPKYLKKNMDEFLESIKNDKMREIIFHDMQTDYVSFDNIYYNSQGFDNIYILTSPNRPEAISLSISEYAKRINKKPYDAFFDLLIDNHGEALACFFEIEESTIDAIYKFPQTVVGSDGIITLNDSPVHPRAYGSFVRSLCRFVKEKHLVSLEEAIYKQTYLTASRWKIYNKGLIKDGYDADLVLMDYASLKDCATFENSRELCDGIISVFVNGEMVYHNKKLTGKHPGKILLSK